MQGLRVWNFWPLGFRFWAWDFVIKAEPWAAAASRSKRQPQEGAS